MADVFNTKLIHTLAFSLIGRVFLFSLLQTLLQTFRVRDLAFKLPSDTKIDTLL